MTEWPIKDVARATGVTSRTLRHYEQIGLLRPSRVASNGYRFYGVPELSRLYRILSLRALDLPLATIQLALNDTASLPDAIESHLALLKERLDRTTRQIADVRQTLDAVRSGQAVAIEDVFAGVDPNQYESEVRERWGDEAWERSAKRRNQMSEQRRREEDRRSLDVNAALRAAADAGEDPAGTHFQGLIGDHYHWITGCWGGVEPDQISYTGLSELYVTDPRFSATYGGRRNAEAIREAMRVWISANLSQSATQPSRNPWEPVTGSPATQR